MKFQYIELLDRLTAFKLQLNKHEDVVFLIDHPTDDRVTKNEQLWDE